MLEYSVISFFMQTESFIEFLEAYSLYNFLLSFNGFVVILSVFLIFISKSLIRFLDTTDLEKKHISEEDEKQIQKKLHFFRVFNIFIFFVYFISLWIELNFINNFSKILIISLILYIANAWCVKKILLFYGDEVEISWEKYFKKWYKASFFSFLTQTTFSVIAFFLIVEILWIDNYLQLWWIIAWIIAFFGFTSAVWAPDVISGIIILHNDRIQIWNVVFIKELGLHAWVKRISLTEIKLVDLVYSHSILIRPSVFRNYTIENLSTGIIWKKSHFKRNIEIQISYENTQKQVEDLCNSAYENMLSKINESEKKYFNLDAEITLDIKNFENDAVLYKLQYEITSPFYIVKAEQLFNSYLKLAQEKHKISFSTPKLIDLQK